jgi:hypothetical protein
MRRRRFKWAAMIFPGGDFERRKQCCRAMPLVVVALAGPAPLHALGFIEHERHPKYSICQPSQRWRSVASKRDATLLAARARDQRKPTPSQPATASTNAS